MIGPQEVAAVLARHGRVAVALIEAAQGSTPRDTGAAMLITPEGTAGSIGGGSAEWQVVTRARVLLGEAGPAHEELLLTLSQGEDQCCGGVLKVALAVLEGDVPPGPLTLWPGGPELAAPAPQVPVLIYGAGHVGRALARALEPLPFHVTLIAVREGAAGTKVSALPEAEAERAPDDAAHIVLTHSHALDLEIVAAVLARPHRFCGLIGSDTKAALFRKRLAERGLAQEAKDRLVCPIGLPGLRDKRPEVIAASVAAQLLLLDAP